MIEIEIKDFKPFSNIKKIKYSLNIDKKFYPNHLLINLNEKFLMCTKEQIKDGIIKYNNKNTFFGILSDGEFTFELPINKISHYVKNVYLNDDTNCIMGDVFILDTPAGNNIQLLELENIEFYMNGTYTYTYTAKINIISFNIKCS